MVKILFFASNPIDTRRLTIDEEIRLIQSRIRGTDYRDVLTLVPAMAARHDDLLQLLNEHKPKIVHFSGHSSRAGEIILTDENRRAKPVSPASLKKLFAAFQDDVRLVVLNACFTQVQADGIKEVVECVVGMREGIKDSFAIRFAASFYRAIGFSHSVQNAFDQGCLSISLENIPGDYIPQLVHRPGIDPSKVFIVDPLKGSGGINLRVPGAKFAAELERHIERGENLLTKLKKSPPSSQTELDLYSRDWHRWRQYSEQILRDSFNTQEPLRWLKSITPHHQDYSEPAWEARAGNLNLDIERELAFLKNLAARVDNY